MAYNEENGTVIYRSRMHAKTKRNFEVFSAEDFIAAITQHIPDKGFQMVRYYGWYSNRARGERAKRRAEGSEPDIFSGLGSPEKELPAGQGPQDRADGRRRVNPAGVQVIDVSDYQPRRLPSKKWRELIKKVWEIDPMNCPRCGWEMRMVALIDDGEVIEKILRHLDLWPKEALPARAPPELVIQDYTIEPVLDDLPFYDEAIQLRLSATPRQVAG